jgi:hypothetical protein
MNEQIITGNVAGQQPLSGQQMQTLAARYNTQLQEIYRDIKLRELALDKAVEFSKSPLAQVPDVMKLARDMHAFLVEAAHDQGSGLTAAP